MIDFVHPIFQINPNGYLPLKGEMDRMKIKETSNEKKGCLYDSLKLAYMEAFVKEVKEYDIHLIIVASPVWYGKNDKQFEPLASICKKYEIPFMNYSNVTSYVRNDEMFKDGNHLNDHGADVFTKEICGLINYNQK